MIRPFEPQDLNTIVDIGNRAWQGIYDMFERRYGEELFRIITPDRAACKGEQVRQHAEAHPDQLLVCEDAGRVIGFVTFRLDRDRRIGEIGNNAVDPALRGKGYGQELYAAVLERFRQEGMLYAKVSTGLDEAHAPARRAYERAGFNLHHENVTYYCKLGND